MDSFSEQNTLYQDNNIFIIPEIKKRLNINSDFVCFIIYAHLYSYVLTIYYTA